ncbi:MAG: 30S ribosomal protein S12 methylthiotransferase RimO [Deltaproteobacteria bacterium]|nr:30S ribosomal protein S12 methylthiotransferase RimO [Deltaproteobacteria bacterium]
MSRVHFISLGCPKNRVDAEHMLGTTLQKGHELTDDAEAADTIVINTCSFIGEAKKESIETILEMAELKEEARQEGRELKLVVSGCLAQRYVDDLVKELPEVDHFLGTSDYMAIESILDGGDASLAKAEGEKTEHAEGFVPLTSLTSRNLVTNDLTHIEKSSMPRVNSMARHTAYLKVAEGCDNACAFCIIPQLRGKQRSRPIADLVTEAKDLVATGVVELNLIAQDLTGYGHDLRDDDGNRPTLAQLLAALSEVEGLRWIRCMYAYPRTLSGALMEQLDTGEHVLPYLDIPTQHGSDRMLKLMRRGKDQRRLKELLLRSREAVRNLVLRSTVIVGFPGEEDEDFDMLVDFVETVRFERLGVFKYSNEEDTAAYELDDQVKYDVKRSRFDKLMRRQRKVHKAKMKELVGTVHEAIVDGPSEEHEYLVVGRLWSQAPEIDGMTYLSSTRSLNAGDIVHVRITEAHDYDVVAEVLDDSNPLVKTSLPFNSRENEAPASPSDDMKRVG